MKLTFGVLEVDAKCPNCRHDSFMHWAVVNLYMCKNCKGGYTGEFLAYAAPYTVIHNPTHRGDV